jgi:putative inorganic carbon (hco3(-)) transporter
MKGLLFTYLLTYGGAIVSIFRPYHGFLIYVAFAILKPDYLWQWSVPEGNYSRIVALALLIGWSLHGFGSWRFGRGRAIVALLVTFWIWLMVGSIWAGNPDRAWNLIEGLSKTFLPFVIGATLIDSVAKLKQLAWVIVLTQGYLGIEFNLIYVNYEFSPLDFKFGGLDNNGIAITMVTVAGMALFLGLYAERWWQKAVALFLAAGMMHFVLFSMSRGGVTALIISGAVAFVLIPKTFKHYLVLAVVILLGVRLAGPEVRERFLTSFAKQEEADLAREMRVRQWSACWASMQQRPFGVGPAQWPFTCPEYGLPLGMAAHSTWMQVGAEEGIPGLMCLLGFYLVCVMRLWRLAWSDGVGQDPAFAYLARMVIASVAGFIVSAQFVSLEGVETPYYIALIGVGVLRLSTKQTQSAENHPFLHAESDPRSVAYPYEPVPA